MPIKDDEKRKRYRRNYYQNNKEKIDTANRKWEKNNIEKHRERRNNYMKEYHYKNGRTYNKINEAERKRNRYDKARCSRNILSGLGLKPKDIQKILGLTLSQYYNHIFTQEDLVLINSKSS